MRTGLNSIKRKYITKNLGEKVSSKCSFNHKLVKGNKEKLYAMTHKNQLFIWIEQISDEFNTRSLFFYQVSSRSSFVNYIFPSYGHKMVQQWQNNQKDFNFVICFWPNQLQIFEWFLNNISIFSHHYTLS